MTDESLLIDGDDFDLPDSWVWTSINTLYEVVGGGTPSTEIKEYWAGDIPWISSADIYGIHNIQPRRFITREAIANSATNCVPAGSIIVVTRVGLGKLAIADYDLCFSQDSQALINNSNQINKRYILYYLSRAVQIFKYRSRGTTISGVTKKVLKDLPVPLAPLNEQRRIVDEIEAQFTRLDAGIAALKRLEANLKRYKASVLKAACEGDLVPQDPEDEPASELLARILQERREKWEAEQLARYKAQGQKPPKGWQDRYQAPVEPDTDDLPELPDGWVWASFDSLIHLLKNGYFGGRPDENGNGIPILTIGAVRPMRVNLTERKYLSEKEDKMDDYWLNENDLLFVRYNGNVHYVGACGMVRDLSDDLLYPDKLIRTKLVNEELTLPAYLELYFATHVPRSIIELQVVSSAGQNGISGTSLKSLPVALPPHKQQFQIVDEASKHISVIDALLSSTEKAFTRAERLRQSILKEAFTGRLVSQDPDDEPASELLKRIQAEREK